LNKENAPISESRVTGILGSEMALSGGTGRDFGLAGWVKFATHHWGWRVGQTGQQQE